MDIDPFGIQTKYGMNRELAIMISQSQVDTGFSTSLLVSK